MEFLSPSKYAYIPLGEWIEKYVKDWLFAQRPVFKKISVPIENTLDAMDALFNLVPLPLVILFFVFAAFKTNGLKFAIFTFAQFSFHRFIKCLGRNYDHDGHDCHCRSILLCDWYSCWDFSLKK
jgi:ABC-type proline/glycine betaine transport system permease subunit